MSKNLEETMDFLNYVAETSKAWDEPNPREVEKIRPTTNSKGRMYSLTKDVEMKAKLSTLVRRLEELEMRNQHEVRAVTKTPVLPNRLCFISQSIEHQGEHCPTIPSMREMIAEQANAVGQYKPPINAPYSNTYNPNWTNHLNLSWKPKPPAYVPHGAQQQYGFSSQPQPPPSSSPVEQAIMNLSKVVGSFVEEQKAINTQANQRIDAVESTLNKKIENLQFDLAQKFDNLQYSISRLTN